MGDRPPLVVVVAIQHALDGCRQFQEMDAQDDEQNLCQMLSERLADYLDGNQEMFATQMAKCSQQPA